MQLLHIRNDSEDSESVVVCRVFQILHSFASMLVVSISVALIGVRLSLLCGSDQNHTKGIDFLGFITSWGYGTFAFVQDSPFFYSSALLGLAF